jgi:hypothetical protein
MRLHTTNGTGLQFKEQQTAYNNMGESVAQNRDKEKCVYMKSYMVWITSPPTPPEHFTVFIVPSGGNTGARVREQYYESEDVLRQDLTASLPSGMNVETIIRRAREKGLSDLREMDIRLTDESAKRLGWID